MSILTSIARPSTVSRQDNLSVRQAPTYKRDKRERLCTANTAKTAAIGYVRVSTEEQATEGVSLDSQRAKIVGYADLHGLDLIDTIGDEGISGKRADNRPGLQRALDAACHNKAVLVVYSLSRLARSTRDCIEIADRIERCGADLASISEKIDTTSSMGRFFFRLMASLGELERDQISERTVAAMSHLRRQSKRISGTIPFGLDLASDGSSLTVNPDESAVLSSIQGQRQSGASYREIAASLNASGIRPKCAAVWYGSSVRAVLLTTDRRAVSIGN